MRASRLLSILTTLQAKGHVTARALADECEVSLRTIYRDVEALSAAGIPVYSERGSSGGYRLLDGYRVRLNGLSITEAEALFLAGLMRQATDLGLGPVAASARNKLLAALPAELRPAAMRARFHLDAPAWFAEGERLEYLPLVADAVWNEHPIVMVYQSRDAESERTVEPLGIILKGGAWYLAAQSGGDVRSYRVSRIRKLQVLERRFDYPAAFDIEAYWTQSAARYEEGLHPNRAEISLSPRGMAAMNEVLPPYMRGSAVIADEVDERGWRSVTLSVGSIEHAAIEILRLGTEAEVISPPELRSRLAEIGQALTDIYRRVDPG